MDTYKREIAILYEFLINNSCLTYDNLCTQFDSSEKTIREDIKAINDNFKSFGINIKLTRGKGFSLSCKNSDIIEDLKKQFEYRFIDTNDIRNNLVYRTDRVLAYILSYDNYIKLNNISLLLNLHLRSTSTVLSKAKIILAEYNLQLRSKPHYGMKLIGREIDIRYCFIDTICFYSNYATDIDLFGDDLQLFAMDENEKDVITKICIDYIKHSKLMINQIEIRKLIILIMVSHHRNLKKHYVKFSDNEIDIIKEYTVPLNIDYLIEKLEQFYRLSYLVDEIIFIKLFIYLNLDYSVSDYLTLLNPKTLAISQKNLDKIIDELQKYNICTKDNQKIFQKFLFPIAISATIRGLFNIVEYNANSSLKKAVFNSPLCATIGNIVFNTLKKVTECQLGETVYVNVSLAVYSCIRQTRNIRKMNSIAILTPFDSYTAEPLKRRILDRYSNIVKQIDILTTSDLLANTLKKYNHLIYFENMPPLGLETNIHKLKVDYYFTEIDVKNFFEYIANPSRIYKSSFANHNNYEYIKNFKFSGLDDLKKELLTKIEEPNIIKQINDLRLSSRIIFDNTLNIILFAQSEKDLFSKLIVLDHNHHYNNNHFNRIFIHVIKIDGDMIKLKTAEKVIRNLTCIEDTDDTILSKPYVDFYEYYIYNRKVFLD